MYNNVIPNYTLNNGVEVPVMALGTALNGDENEICSTIKYAYEYGYRSIDTAAAYLNQKAIGKALKINKIKREDIYLTSKVWNSNHGYEKTLNDFKNTLKELDVEYIDEFLIHWPGQTESFLPTWKALEKLYKNGEVRVIGVSNFLVHHLKRLMEEAEIQPMVNQVELNPLFIPFEEINFCKRNNIQLEAQRPIRIGDAYKYPVLNELAKKYNKNPIQIVLRWHLDQGIRPLPKTVHRERLESNINVFDFKLSKEEIEEINKLNTGIRVSGQDPDKYFEIDIDFEGT